MAEKIYAWLQHIGFSHPLHPIMTHLPVGLIIGAVIFRLIAGILRKPDYSVTAHRCLVLALAGTVPTVLLGIADWQHFYASAWLRPIQIKMGLAALLVILLLAGSIRGFGKSREMKGGIGIYVACLAVVGGLGYLGGELVYGSHQAVTAESAAPSAPATKGADIFAQYCSGCHYADRKNTKVGPGLAGLSSWQRLPTSGWPADAAHLKRQMIKPYADMPSFGHLPDQDIDALVVYLKTL